LFISLIFRTLKSLPHLLYRGIAYSVRKIGTNRWAWEINPPEGVRGLKRECGELDGDEKEASLMALRAIDRQISTSGDRRLW
jgi:hypothetical protein